MKLTTEIDMSAAWKGLQCGGAAKVHTFPCHCCGVRSDDLHHPAHTTCDTCNNQPAGWHCYHHPIVTESVLEEKKESVSEMTTALQQQLATIDQSMLTIEDPVTPEGSATRNESSIHFVPQGSAPGPLKIACNWCMSFYHFILVLNYVSNFLLELFF